MKYLLDNDAISIFYDANRGDRHMAIKNQISHLADEDQLQTSVLILYELEFSFHNASEEKRPGIRTTIQSLLEDFKILPVPQNAASTFGELKAFLKKKKNLTRKEMRKHNIDIAIASTALQEGAAIISSDPIYKALAEYKQEFKSFDWTKHETLFYRTTHKK